MEFMLDILSYVIAIGCVFAAVCAMTRGGRGWHWRLVALGALIAVNVVDEAVWRFGRMSLDFELAVSFAGKSLVILVLIFGLSHDSFGRRFFLSIVYSGYAVCFAVVFHLLSYRNVFGLSDVGSAAAGNGAVVLLNLVFLCWILPLMPRDNGRDSRWGESCIAAGAVAVLLYASGIWPISVITAPARYCSAFVVAAVVAWAVFPVLCRLRNERVRTVAAEQSVALLTAEMRERRAAIDEARRIRHDRRHDRIVICDFLLRGQTKEALEYLDALEKDTDRQADLSQVWCENMTVNAILSGYARKAAAKGVGFTAEAHVERTSPLPDTELVAVVANLVENAVDATACRVRKEGADSNLTRQAAASTERMVTVTLRQRGDTFGMTVTNPVPPDFHLSSAGLPCAVPGVGLGSVLRVIRKHAGDGRYVLENGMLTCEVRICGGV